MMESTYKSIIRRYRQIVFADRSFIDKVQKDPSASYNLKLDAKELLEKHEEISKDFVEEMSLMPPKGQTTLVGLRGG